MEEKIGDVDNKIPDLSDLVTTTVLNMEIGEVESKISDVSGLVKNADYNTQISEIILATRNINQFINIYFVNLRFKSSKICFSR